MVLMNKKWLTFIINKIIELMHTMSDTYVPIRTLSIQNKFFFIIIT